MRVEKEVLIIRDREASDKSPNVAWRFDLKDNEGNEYEWNTVTNPDPSIFTGQKWIVRMTLKTIHEVMGHEYTRVERVKFIKRIG